MATARDEKGGCCHLWVLGWRVFIYSFWRVKTDDRRRTKGQVKNGGNSSFMELNGTVALTKVELYDNETAG
jgi:hypothetical protein